MKILIFTLLSLTLVFSAQAESSKSVKFDLATSVLKWTGKKVTGSHTGELRLKSATGQINSDQSVAGTFQIDMTSLKNTDIETPKDNKKLVDHLSSPDFFKIDAFPVVTFEITKSTPIKDAKTGEANVNITGRLSIKGITHPLTFPALVSVADGKVSAKGTAVVDRTQFDVRYGSGKFFEGLGDKLIYDDFEVEVNLEGQVI